MANGTILPPNTPLIDGRGNLTPEWYRYLASLQRDVTSNTTIISNTTIATDGSIPPAADDSSSIVAEAGLSGFPPILAEPAIDNFTPPYAEPDPVYRAAPLTVSTDVDFSIAPDPAGKTIRHTSTLTADRVATILTTGASPGTQTLIVRTGGGAFNLSAGGVKNLTTNTWALVEFDAAMSLFLASYGAL